MLEKEEQQKYKMSEKEEQIKKQNHYRFITFIPIPYC
jgi:hypothetical protein